MQLIRPVDIDVNDLSLCSLSSYRMLQCNAVSAVNTVPAATHTAHLHQTTKLKPNLVI